MNKNNFGHYSLSSNKNPPMKKDLNDPWFLLLWGWVMSTWIVMIFISFVQSELPVTLTFNRHSSNGFSEASFDQKLLLYFILGKHYDSITYYFEGSKWMNAVGLMISLTFALGSLVLGRYQPFCCCIIGMICLPIMILFSIFNIHGLLNILFLGESEMLFVLPYLVPEFPTTIFNILFLICISKVALRQMSNVIRSTAQSVIIFLHLIPFVLILYTLVAIIVTLSLAALRSLGSGYIMFYVIFFGGCYLTLSLHYYGIAVVSEVAASWNCEETKLKNPSRLIMQCIASTVWYRFGSIAFAATVIGPIIASAIAIFNPRREYNPTKTMIARIFDTLLTIYLLLNVTKYSLVVSSVCGGSFIECTKEAFHLLRRDSRKSFSFIGIFHGLLIAVFGIMVISTVVVIIVWTKPSELFDDLKLHRILGMLSFTTRTTIGTYLILLLPLYSIVDTTGQTNYLCTIKDGEQICDTKDELSAIPLRSEA